MSFLSRALRRVSRSSITAGDHKPQIPPEINFSSATSITPIKMAMDVFQSNATNPNAPALIVMHGLLGSKNNFRSICKGLEGKTKRKIYNVDARNHGESPHVSGHSSAHMSADVALLVQEENLQKVSVMGHSMGGKTMMYFTLTYPQLVEKAIIVDISPVSFPNNYGSMDVVFNAMKNVKVSSNLSLAEGRAIAERQLVEAIGDKDAVKFLMQNFKKLKTTGEFAWRANIVALQSSISQFHVAQRVSDTAPCHKPVLFIAGSRSKFLNPDDWPKIKEIFPNAELKWLDAGHLVHFTQPEKFMNHVIDFLR